MSDAMLGRRVLWIAPLHKQANEGWSVMRLLAAQIPGTLVLESEREIQLPSGGRIECRTGSDPDALRGGGWGLVIFDECPLLQERIWTEVVRPALMDTKGRAVFIGTPRGMDWFYDLYQNGVNGVPGWASWRLPSHNNPLLDRDELAAFEAEVKAKEGERTYLAEILAEFLPDGGGLLRGVGAASSVAPEPPQSNQVYSFFWDTAGSVDKQRQGDYNAVVGFRRDGNALRQVYADRFGNVEWQHALARLQRIRGYRGMLYMDAGGANIYAESGIADAARVVGPLLRVAGHKFTPANKWDMTRNLITLLEATPQRVKLLSQDLCTDADTKAAVVQQGRELNAWQGIRSITGHIAYRGPDGTHDDMAVAVMAACELADVAESAQVVNRFMNLGARY